MSTSPSTLPRSQELAILRQALEFSRAVALVGPRQCGKTTLAREFVAPESPNYFDLEDEADLARLENAAFALGHF
jgi:predicted AAA+ superfamily ATPase